MRIAFVGHSYHQTTKSNEWLKKILEDNGQVDYYFDDSWRSEKKLNLNSVIDYDRIIVYQTEYVTEALAKIIPRKTVFIPMYDGFRQLSDKSIYNLRGISVFSLSWKIHETLQRGGINSFYAQYFPNPENIKQQDNFKELRGYFWLRRNDVTLNVIKDLIGNTPFSKFHLHIGIDPDVRFVDGIDPIFLQKLNATISIFSSQHNNSINELNNSNVYFAPRAYEGIGMAFLEAMARGQCVVSPNNATMSEYITHNVNGLMYNTEKLDLIDFSCAEEIGKNARRKIENGYNIWQDALKECIPTMLLDNNNSNQTKFSFYQRKLDINLQATDLKKDEKIINVTVALVTLNSSKLLEKTLESITSQVYKNFELILVDGLSTDNSIEIIEKYKNKISKFVQEKDDGPYDAMNKVAKIARGKYIIYMNAGDYFYDDYALERCIQYAPSNADVIYGHHIYILDDGREEYHPAEEFNSTWERLKLGHLDLNWLKGIPCHQATLTRTELLLEQGGYSLKFPIAADHEMLYRLRSRNANFWHCGEILAIYTAGGLSGRGDYRKDWYEVTSLYGNKSSIEVFFGRGNSNYETDHYKCNEKEENINFYSIFSDISLKSVYFKFKKLNRQRIKNRRIKKYNKLNKLL